MRSPAPSSGVSRSFFPRQKGRMESDAFADRCCGEEIRLGLCRKRNGGFMVSAERVMANETPSSRLELTQDGWSQTLGASGLSDWRSLMHFQL